MGPSRYIKNKELEKSSPFYVFFYFEQPQLTPGVNLLPDKRQTAPLAIAILPTRCR